MSETFSSTYASSSQCRSETSGAEQFLPYGQAAFAQRQMRQPAMKRDVPANLLIDLSDDELEIC